MNRSIDRRCFATFDILPGEIVVAPFIHPDRGPVEYPAAPLVAARLRTEHHRVRVSHRPLDVVPDNADSVMFTVSYRDRHGIVIGVCVAAHRSDTAAVAVAQESVATWASTLRTRRLLIAAGTRCEGVRGMFAAINHRRQQGSETMHVLGGLGMSPADVDVRCVSMPEAVPDGGTVVVPAQGVPARTRATSNARRLRVVDTTCPLVAAAAVTRLLSVQECVLGDRTRQRVGRDGPDDHLRDIEQFGRVHVLRRMLQEFDDAVSDAPQDWRPMLAAARGLYGAEVLLESADWHLDHGSLRPGDVDVLHHAHATATERVLRHLDPLVAGLAVPPGRVGGFIGRADYIDRVAALVRPVP